ncbi:MAG: PH domain-containing protein [Lachnospiraceae bacterium]|nr:PH domain-containing protein [Lachnospiraceae bacterium]
MRLKGKVAVWFWLILFGANAIMIYELIFSRDNLAALIIGFLVCNIIFWPIVLRNYVEIKDDKLTVCFGLGKDSIEIKEITEVYTTHDPIASSAASLDRIVIKGRRQELMCSVCDKEKLFHELRRINPAIQIR